MQVDIPDPLWELDHQATFNVQTKTWESRQELLFAGSAVFYKKYTDTTLGLDGQALYGPADYEHDFRDRCIQKFFQLFSEKESEGR